MYPFRKIFQSTKYFKNYIYTSSVKFENSKKSDKHSDVPEEKVENHSEFIKLLNFKQVEQKSSASLDVKEEQAHLKSKETAKKSNKSQKQGKVKKPGTGLENFFESASAKKALNSAAESVAKELGENKAAVKHDLMHYLQMLKVTKEKSQEPKYTVKSKLEPNASLESIFFKVKNLHIFNDFPDDHLKSQVKLNIWDNLEREELEYLSKTSPRNHFEELINWTNEGRMWNFPIDNEQGLDEEAKVTFTEHIFLEKYLEPWCPKKGPLRRFMDLVLIGLGKNPYLSVEEKKEHIQWFQDYFESKKKLLLQIGAMSPQKEIEAPGSQEKP